MRFLILNFTMLALLSACSPKLDGGTSNVSLRVPTLSELQSQSLSDGSSKDVISQSISVSDRDWSKACFMVNVTGPGIADPTVRPTCGIPTGAFSGSVGPGGSLTVAVPKGDNRKFEIFAYFRSSSALPCDSKKSVNEFDLGHTARMGSATASIQKDDEAVDINLSLSAAAQTVVSQYGLPVSCDASASAGTTSLTATSGAAVNASSGGGYKLSSRVSPPNTRNLVSPGGYKLIRRGQQ